MAGIGFELQRVITKGGIGSFFKVALAGMIIVAGPWLLSLITIFSISRIASEMLQEGPDLFMSVIIYTYSTSLFFFGGTHYIFTRYLSDLVYKKQDKEAGALLLIFSSFIMIMATGISLPVIVLLDTGLVSHPQLFKAGAYVLYIVTNIMWVLMVFISLLKKYMNIFLSFLAGMSFSFAGVFVLGYFFGLGGAMLGFSLGQFITMAILGFLSFSQYRPGNFKTAFREFFTYFPRHLFLFLGGIFYYAGTWIDKFIFWIYKGSPVENTLFKLYDLYDIPIYLANLAMIPGLIYFIVVTETDFFIQLKKFLHSIANSIYVKIIEQKFILKKSLYRGVRDQSLFEGIFIFFIIIIAPAISSLLFRGGINIAVFRLSLLAVFFHFTYLSLMIFLFYLQQYRSTFICSLIFFLINLSVSLLSVYYPILPGISYLCSGMAASLIAGIILIRNMRRIDRLIYLQYSK